MKMFIVLLLSTVSCLAQTAKVIALTPEESNRIKNLTQQKKEIEKQIENVRLDIIHNHLRATEGACFTNEYVNQNDPNDPIPESLNTELWVATPITGNYVFYGNGCSSSTDNAATLKKERKEFEDKKKIEDAWIQRHPRLYHKWDCSDSFEFSEDYKYIVPLITKTNSNSVIWTTPSYGGTNLNLLNGGVTLTN